LVSSELLSFDEVNKKIWDNEFEIFIPAAASRLVNKDQVDRMIASKLEVFSCGANVPFADPEIFFGPTGLYADQKFFGAVRSFDLAVFMRLLKLMFRGNVKA